MREGWSLVWELSFSRRKKKDQEMMMKRGNSGICVGLSECYVCRRLVGEEREWKNKSDMCNETGSSILFCCCKIFNFIIFVTSKIYCKKRKNGVK